MSDASSIAGLSSPAELASARAGLHRGSASRVFDVRGVAEESGFRAALGRVSEPGREPMSPERARDAAQEFVAVALVQPTLAQMREPLWASEPFAPGQHEKTFAPMLDAEIAKRIVTASGFPLVDRIAEQLSRQSSALETARSNARALGTPLAEGTA